MSIFLSKYINKLDKKGRVSIPATYRSILSREEIGGIIVYSSFKNHCIEVCSMSRLQKISNIIAELDPYSPERDAFETVVLGESVHLLFDNEGRVTLPTHLIELAQITENVCIVGKGEVFEIWNPDNFAKYLTEAKEIAQKNKLLLRNIQAINNRGQI